MGLHADALALAELTGKDVKECKRALKKAGGSLRNMTVEEKAKALSWAEQAPAPARKETPPPPPPPPPEDKPVAALPPVEKDIDPAPEPQVRDEPEVEPQAPKVIETFDEDEMGSTLVDED